jgi:hypothetical protein
MLPDEGAAPVPAKFISFLSVTTARPAVSVPARVPDFRPGDCSLYFPLILSNFALVVVVVVKGKVESDRETVSTAGFERYRVLEKWTKEK